MTTEKTNQDFDQADFERLTEALCSWFVRRDGKYYAVDRLGTKLSKDDVVMIAMGRFRDEFDDVDLTQPLLKAVFEHAISKKHAIQGQTISVWNGREYCAPDVEASTICERGAVAVNAWRCPAFRMIADVAPDWGVAGEFINTIFTREAEKEMFLDWLAWCLQNEGDKPNWAPFFYSATKGSGKSTLCQLAARLFGDGNVVTQNNVDKLTGRFNATVLTRKLVICEELHLRQDSPQGNALKTYLTESQIMTERKGQDAEQVDHCCCFLFTTNHLPLWIEPEDRRYYVVEIDHDGHAIGPRSDDFAALVGRVYAFMDDERAIAGLYRTLMERRLGDRFSAKTLNVERDATPIMRRIQGASEQTVRTQLAEMLDQRGQHAVPESDVVKLIREDLKQNPNSTRHMMTELGWSKCKAKWDGKDYVRAIWVREGFWIERGKVRGPDGYSQAIAQHLHDPLLPEEDQDKTSEAVINLFAGDLY
ncbi:MAG TPA: primase-helicase family protein [Roseovarius sp.]|nr:primase-helicase family protein [Roseovarius sp.]